MLDKVDRIVKLKKELDKVNEQIAVVEQGVTSKSITAIKLIFDRTPSINLDADQNAVFKIANQFVLDLRVKRQQIELELENMFSVSEPKTKKKWL